MKHLTDLTNYKGILPYASEIFGIYQPLLGWKSQRTKKRHKAGADSRLDTLLGRIIEKMKPDIKASFSSSDRSVQVKRVMPAHTAIPPTFTGVVASSIARTLPTADKIKPEVWDRVLGKTAMNKIMKDHVTPHVTQTYQTLTQQVETARQGESLKHAEATAMDILAKESRSAGILQMLQENGQYSLLKELFYGRPDKMQILWRTVASVYDPFDYLDPTRQLDRVGLSPVGIAHLFRQYFFELDTFLGTPVGHIWVSPGSTVELYEAHTRRVLTEQTLEQSVESLRKSENSLNQQSDLADAVKSENKSDTKLGVTASASQNWGICSTSESASFNMDSSESQAREESHKSMRQQSSKLSSEIKQNFKTTFRTVTETTDLSTKRYVLSNNTERLLNYELRRKMRQVVVQVQDIGSYLCWQTYVDAPGEELGVARLVHVATPPDLAQIPVPDMIVPPQAFSEDMTFTIPFMNDTTGYYGSASNDDTFDNGIETSLGSGDFPNRIIADFKQGPVRCSQAGFRLASVKVTDAKGTGAILSVSPSSIEAVDPTTSGTPAAPGNPGTPATTGSYTFMVHLDHINFQSKDSMPVKATLYWDPVVDEAAIAKANQEQLKLFTAREKLAFRKSYLDEARERIKLASNIQPRNADDLREEERVVVYRRIIQDMLAPEAVIPRPDAQSQHIVAELINSIFDVDKLLYFVAPEWWRPREHSHQQLGAMDSMLDANGKTIGAAPQIPKQDPFGWGGDQREDNYYITEESTPARLGSSLGWLLQLDGDDHRNAFLNAPWVKAVLPIRPGKEKAALNWLKHVEGINGIGPNDLYTNPKDPAFNGKPMFDVLLTLADKVTQKHAVSNQTQPYQDPMDPGNTVYATPIDRVYEHGFDPLAKGFRAQVQDNNDHFQVFDQWLEILPTDQVAAVEVTYDPITGRQVIP